ncbi:hypothetical protein [Plantactinospora veratri]
MRSGSWRWNPAERRVRSAFGEGAEVDLRGTAYPVRAELLVELLTGDANRAGSRAGLRVRSARIVGRLDLRHAEITVPVSISGCTFTDVPELTEARAVNLVLADCTLPGLRARLLELRGDLALLRCVVTGPVDLRDARVGGTVTLNGSRLADRAGSTAEVFPPIDPGTALAAGRLTVTGNLHARQGFVAEGQVWLGGAQVGGNLDLDGATLRHPTGAALSADRLTVAGSLTARYGFTAEGAVLLIHAQIGNQLNFHHGALRGRGRSPCISGVPGPAASG